MRLIRVVIIRYYIVLVDAWWMDYCVYEIWNMEKTGVHNHNLLSGVSEEGDR